MTCMGGHYFEESDQIPVCFLFQRVTVFPGPESWTLPVYAAVLDVHTNEVHLNGVR